MKHKWLEEVGIKDYPDNSWSERSPWRKWTKSLKYGIRKRKTGVDPRDCWDLQASFYRWLYEHLCQLEKDTCADLSWDTFDHGGRTFTEEEYIGYLKELLIKIIKMDVFEGVPSCPLEGEVPFEVKEKVNEALRVNAEKEESLRREIMEVLGDLLPSLWW